MSGEIINEVLQWVVLVDMDQPNIRRTLLITSDEEGQFAETFSNILDIQQLKRNHQLGVFSWWAFNMITGEGVEV